MYTVELEEFRAAYASFPKTADGKAKPTQEFREKLLAFHYSSGMSLDSIGTKSSINAVTLYNWKRKEGAERTAFTHGKYIRYDVRTKSMAVKELAEGMSYEEVALKYYVSKQAVQNWERMYGSKLELYLDLPDGVPHIIHQDKHIYGNLNIGKVARMLRQQRDMLDKLIMSLQKGV